ncbi:MAG: efflux RND transporter periplasmic adaptor subunit, partial [Betaproteobacteria bacterium]|nr:efflux RND transporter periplasmic adaptor subunit [Betaproteobacteria bacterium]
EPHAADRRIEYAGEIRARHETKLAFRVGGKLIERRVDAGTRVRAGQTVAKLDATDLALATATARAQVASLEAERELARAELVRTRGLREKNFISQAELERRANAFATVEARLDAARAQHRQVANQAGYALLKADTDGIITAVEAEAGQIVAPGQTVLRLARLSPRGPARGELEVAFAVPESQREGIERARDFTVTLNAHPGRRWQARLREISPAADAATRTYAAHAALVDPGTDVELGMSARVEVRAAQTSARIEVPLAALYTRSETAQVFVVNDDRTVRLQPVTTAGVTGERVAIAAGLAPGDVVVAAGAQLLRPGQPVRILGAPAHTALSALAR